METIETSFNDGDTIFQTSIEGISLPKLKSFCIATNSTLKDYYERKKHYVPGVYVIAMFRHVVKKLHKENPNFPLKKLKSFYGHNGGTIENRIFINEKLTYRFAKVSMNGNKIQFKVEITRNLGEIVLKGLFQLVK